MLAFVFGTLVTSILALIFAVPLSIGIALFMTEVAPAWLKTPVVYVMDLLAVVPSVVFGLWGVLVLADADLALLHEREQRPVADPDHRRALRESGERPLVLHRRRDPGDHDRADHHLAHPRGVRHDAAGARRKPPSRSAPPGGR